VVSGPKFIDLYSLNVGRNAVVHHFSDIGYLYPFRRYSRSKWKGVQNRAKFSMFSPEFFLGQAPNFRTGICKLNMLPTMWQNFAEIGPRISEISRWKKIKKQQQNIRPSWNYR